MALFKDQIFYVSKDLENHTKSTLEKSIRANGGKVTTSFKLNPLIICSSLKEIEDKIDLDDYKEKIFNENYIDDMIEKKGQLKVEDYYVDISKKRKAKDTGGSKAKKAKTVDKSDVVPTRVTRSAAKKNVSPSSSPPSSPPAKKTTKKAAVKTTKKAAAVKPDKPAVDIVIPDKIIKKAKTGNKFPTVHVDKFAPPNFQTCDVYQDNECVWHATLNQTNLNANNNKFYICQLLKGNSIYHCWFRWGRVGYDGANSQSSGSLDDMKRLFQKKYTDKTGNTWNTFPFEPVPGKYTLIEIDESADDDAQPEPESEKEEEDEEETKCLLPVQLQNLLSMIFDLSLIQKTLTEIGYDTNKMPLGKLSESSIKQGYEVLKELAEEINRKSPRRQTLIDLTSRFYTVIPHDFGFGKMIDHLINDSKTVKDKLTLLSSLSDMKVTTKFVQQKTKASNQVTEYYDKLQCDIVPLNSTDDEFHMIAKYIQNSVGETHTYYTLELVEAFKVVKPEMDKKFRKTVKNIGNINLLWHGSRLTNFVGILSQGLRIAPPEAPVTGYMFGKGVYFADCVTKSANYCYTNSSNPEGLMMLCEVALGKTNNLMNSDYNASNLPAGCSSTKGCGCRYPNPKDAITLPDGVIVPTGKMVTDRKQGSLEYNEFIVYDTTQINFRYLMKVKFNYKNSNAWF